MCYNLDNMSPKDLAELCLRAADKFAQKVIHRLAADVREEAIANQSDDMNDIVWEMVDSSPEAVYTNRRIVLAAAHLLDPDVDAWKGTEDAVDWLLQKVREEVDR